MKTDERYSHIMICPETGIQLTEDDLNGSGGVCPHCGNINNYSFTHSNKIAGRWNRPSFSERLFQGKKSEFIRKEDEDKIIASLTQ